MDESLTSDFLMRRDTALAVVLDSIFDGVYIVDGQRRILYWNRGAELITGYTAAEVAGRRCRDDILNHIDEQGRLLCKSHCPLMHTLATGEEVRAKVYPLHKSGRRFPIMTHITPLRNAAGEVIAAIEVFRDISQEEEFRLLQEKFRLLVRRYISQSTYEEVLAQALGTVTEVVMRDMTVFYLDITGFTALSEKTPPQDMVKLLNDVFGLCGVITREHHGDIDKFIGDAIMAVFVDANDAVAAAMTVQNEALPWLNAQRVEEGHPPIRVRIGINSGMVVQGDVGTTDRKDLTVIGDVVNTAQRLESLAEPGTMLLSEATQSRLSPENAPKFKFLREVFVRGKETPIRIYGASV